MEIKTLNLVKKPLDLLFYQKNKEIIICHDNTIQYYCLLKNEISEWNIILDIPEYKINRYFLLTNGKLILQIHNSLYIEKEKNKNESKLIFEPFKCFKNDIIKIKNHPNLYNIIGILLDDGYLEIYDIINDLETPIFYKDISINLKFNEDIVDFCFSEFINNKALDLNIYFYSSNNLIYYIPYVYLTGYVINENNHYITYEEALNNNLNNKLSNTKMLKNLSQHKDLYYFNLFIVQSNIIIIIITKNYLEFYKYSDINSQLIFKIDLNNKVYKVSKNKNNLILYNKDNIIIVYLTEFKLFFQNNTTEYINLNLNNIVKKIKISEDYSLVGYCNNNKLFYIAQEESKITIEYILLEKVYNTKQEFKKNNIILSDFKLGNFENINSNIISLKEKFKKIDLINSESDVKDINDHFTNYESILNKKIKWLQDQIFEYKFYKNKIDNEIENSNFNELAKNEEIINKNNEEINSLIFEIYKKLKTSDINEKNAKILTNINLINKKFEKISNTENIKKDIDEMFDYYYKTKDVNILKLDPEFNNRIEEINNFLKINNN